MKSLLLSLLLLASLNAKDVIYDTSTSLLWQDSYANEEFALTYKQAKEYCQDLVIEEYKDFRIPTLNELQSIIDYKNYKPAIIKGFKYVGNETYWTTTPYAHDYDYVWTVNFKKGARDVKAKHYDRYIRCVQKVK